MAGSHRVFTPAVYRAASEYPALFTASDCHLCIFPSGSRETCTIVPAPTFNPAGNPDTAGIDTPSVDVNETSAGNVGKVVLLSVSKYYDFALRREPHEDPQLLANHPELRAWYWKVDTP